MNFLFMEHFITSNSEKHKADNILIESQMNFSLKSYLTLISFLLSIAISLRFRKKKKISHTVVENASLKDEI